MFDYVIAGVIIVAFLLAVGKHKDLPDGPIKQGAIWIMGVVGAAWAAAGDVIMGFLQ